MRHIAAAFNDLHWQHWEQTQLARRSMISLRQCPGIRVTASRGDSLFEAATRFNTLHRSPRCNDEKGGDNGAKKFSF
jgi:hypothetical protein